jgi:hypothetical protein
MDAERVEIAVDAGAATLFAIGAAMVAGRLVPMPLAGGAALVALIGCFCALRTIQPALATFALPSFTLVEPGVELPLADELLLTDSNRLRPPDSQPLQRPDDALILDDMLVELGPDSRVVRLFDPAAMPTAGQSRSPVGASRTAPDASQALYDALDELRRSLR